MEKTLSTFKDQVVLASAFSILFWPALQPVFKTPQTNMSQPISSLTGYFQ